MKSTLDEYLIKIDNLINYIDQTQHLYEVVKENRDSKISSEFVKFHTDLNKRTYDYNLVIITLYGIWEGFVEQIVAEYLSELNDCVNEYKNLPEAIKENHVGMSADLLKYTNILSKYEHILINEVIANLNSCLNGKEKYKINVDAFTYHSTNFRKDAIRDFFKNIGVFNITNTITKSKAMVNFFTEYDGELLSNMKKYQENNYYEYLEDLVERRNQIAHGSDIDELLSLDILINYSQYVKALIISIYEIIEYELFKNKFHNTEKVELGKPIKVIDSSIICINNKHLNIKTNDYIYGYNMDSKELRFGQVLSIQINNEAVNETSIECDEAVGLKVNFSAKDKYTYFYLYS
ncbi:hypothetical protein GCM10023142_07510 [Anaerocolumna aminovalerica]|uniref:RiboL-PSP-HEPN domain-containing protein n=1 Tax=Anaerocolumna aminovalerica TaxID=1527 RepID=A0A1I5I0F2_9FIRM|nr:MAE_28990/MAE_18760 family HEPN-like nuclease [Anaerocolumna aminovalerica]SFO53997.1 hypothetical protein SAMN04489757_13747 [Anaerocolumna aminovalerica]